MDDSSVVFKGTVNGLTIVMKEDEDIEAILLQIEEKVASAGKFFKGASLEVRYRGKKLTEQEELRVHDLMTKKSGAEILSFEEDTEEVESVQQDTEPKQQGKNSMRLFYFKGIEEGMTKFYRGTVRSGQLVSYGGNLVVIGDVNPGAEVSAAGNVMVMGSLRGVVSTGADGNKEAVVVALNLQPTQLRIADVITRSPDEKNSKNPFIPELAFVKDDMVYIERFLPQYK